MGKNIDKTMVALRHFGKGHNCAQAVVAAFARDCGIDEKTFVRMVSALGGGLAGKGETCGAVTGALLIVGLRYGSPYAINVFAKKKCYAYARKFIDGFIARHGTSMCKELLRCDISDTEGVAFARKNKLFEKNCPDFVKTAVALLESLEKK